MKRSGQKPILITTGAAFALAAVALIPICCLAKSTATNSATTSPGQLQPSTKVGMAGVFDVRYAGGALESKPAAEDPPITLSIGEVADAPAAAGQSAARVYQLNYIGAKAGRFDLRDYLTRIDGRSVADLPPLEVSIVEQLPADFSGELHSLPTESAPPTWPYRALLATVVVGWAFPLVWLATAAWRHRPELPVASVVQPLTLADQLRTLVAAALAGPLTSEQQALLERLLIGFWRERLNLGKLPAEEALDQLRADPEAGELLRQIEQWLYERPGRAPIEAASILRPYEHVGMPSADSRSEAVCTVARQ